MGLKTERESLMSDGLICLQESMLRVCVDAKMGGHIVEFSLEGDNALATDAPEAGSTFWPSPQQAWGWPPPATLDKAPYTVLESESKSSIQLLSAVCDTTGLQLKKTFTLTSERLLVEYTMINPGAKALTFAPWEITRTCGGLTFYQSDESPLDLSTGTAVAEHGFVWHHYRPQTQEQNEKIFGNGSCGWLANVCSGLLLIKEFQPVDSAEVAPGEAEVEIYGHGDSKNPYIEIEQQGAYQVIAPNAQISWQVKWYLRRLSPSVEVAIGNKELPEIVRDVLSLSTRKE